MILDVIKYFGANGIVVDKLKGVWVRW